MTGEALDEGILLDDPHVALEGGVVGGVEPQQQHQQQQRLEDMDEAELLASLAPDALAELQRQMLPLGGLEVGTEGEGVEGGTGAGVSGGKSH